MKNTTITFNDKEIVINYSNKISFIEYSNLICIVFDKPYLIIKIKDNNWMVPFSLSQMIERLPYFFIQCNKSTIINLFLVESYDKRNRVVQLCGGNSYFVSFRKKNEVEKKLLAIRKDRNSFV
jgi:DNA-binding LytR/AlgR family response regulator